MFEERFIEEMQAMNRYLKRIAETLEPLNKKMSVDNPLNDKVDEMQ